MTLSAVVRSVAPAEVNATNDVCWARFHLLKDSLGFCENTPAPVSQVASGQGLIFPPTGANPEHHKQEIPAPGNITLRVSWGSYLPPNAFLGHPFSASVCSLAVAHYKRTGSQTWQPVLTGTSLSVLLGHFAGVVNFHGVFACMLTKSFVWPGMASLGCAVYHQSIRQTQRHNAEMNWFLWREKNVTNYCEATCRYSRIETSPQFAAMFSSKLLGVKAFCQQCKCPAQEGAFFIA